MYELVYAGADVEKLIRGEFPEAKIGDASDDIHRQRFECEVNIPEDNFYIFAIRQGFARCCFGFSCMMKDYPEGSRQKVRNWLAKAKALKE